MTATARRTDLPGLVGFATGTIDHEDQLLELDVAFEGSAPVRGRVFVPTSPTDDGSAPVPAPGAFATATDSLGRSFLAIADGTGVFRFPALPALACGLVFRSTGGEGEARATVDLTTTTGAEVDLGAIVLDLAPPAIVTMVPPPNQGNVPPGSDVDIVFSEPLDPAVLPRDGGPASIFSIATASGTMPVGIWSAPIEGTGRLVRFHPSAPLAGQTTYVVTVQGGPAGVRDRAGRLMDPVRPRIWSFTTADTDGPMVVGTSPDLGRPVSPSATIRIDFNEPIVVTAAQLDPDSGEGAAARLYELDASGSPGATSLVGALAVTRGGYSLEIQPGNFGSGSARRRLVVSGLHDAAGIAMEDWIRDLRPPDPTPPVLLSVSVDPLPAGTALSAGTSYRLTPQLGGLDDVDSAHPFGDLDRVEVLSPSAPGGTTPVEPPVAVVRDAPFGWSFVAPTPDGASGEIHLLLRAVDTSENRSATFPVDFTIVPNQPPTVGTVAMNPSAPSAGHLYPGSTIDASVDRLSDPDGGSITVVAELVAAGASAPLATSPATTLVRPANGWGAGLSAGFRLASPRRSPSGPASPSGSGRSTRSARRRRGRARPSPSSWTRFLRSSAGSCSGRSTASPTAPPGPSVAASSWSCGPGTARRASIGWTWPSARSSR